jgi:hypothetical protein
MSPRRGSKPRRTDRLVVGRNVTLTLKMEITSLFSETTELNMFLCTCLVMLCTTYMSFIWIRRDVIFAIIFRRHLVLLCNNAHFKTSLDEMVELILPLITFCNFSSCLICCPSWSFNVVMLYSAPRPAMRTHDNAHILIFFLSIPLSPIHCYLQYTEEYKLRYITYRCPDTNQTTVLFMKMIGFLTK